jgi:hypothetical protein
MRGRGSWRFDMGPKKDRERFAAAIEVHTFAYIYNYYYVSDSFSNQTPQFSI